ncbi:MAG: helix-turn-helix transcriptional regulator [Legionellales bacterium]|nr:helix-turn-helix transcriptional regulator [Legionellales bacterium]
MTMLALQQDDSMFHLTPEQDMSLFFISQKLKTAGFPLEFISSAVRTALRYEGVADLIFLWNREESASERNEIIADIQELIDDCSQLNKEEYRYIKLNDLDLVRNHIREFKDELLKVVNKAGGINELSKITHIPQPSLSRFFNSNAMPRRRTLLKIAEALNLDAVRINMPWAR